MAKKQPKRRGPKPMAKALTRRHGYRVTFNDAELACLQALRGTYSMAAYIRSCTMEVAALKMRGQQSIEQVEARHG